MVTPLENIYVLGSKLEFTFPQIPSLCDRFYGAVMEDEGNPLCYILRKENESSLIWPDRK